MNILWLTIGISFTFCLALMVGGVLLLFRYGKNKNLEGKGFLQTYLVLIYTYGFYSLWAQVFLTEVPGLAGLENVESIKDIVFLMGTPFLLIGLIFQLMWAYKCQESSSSLRSMAISLPLLFTVIAVVYPTTRTIFLSGDYLKMSSVVAIGLTASAFLVFLSGSTTILRNRWKTVILTLVLLTCLVHLGNFTDLYTSPYYLPVYAFLFFLFNTLAEALFIYTVKVEPEETDLSFRGFVDQYRITKREEEIIREIYDGKTNQEIADELFVTLQTIKDHTSRIYQKTEVKNRTQLVAALRKYI